MILNNVCCPSRLCISSCHILTIWHCHCIAGVCVCHAVVSKPYASSWLLACRTWWHCMFCQQSSTIRSCQRPAQLGMCEAHPFYSLLCTPPHSSPGLESFFVLLTNSPSTVTHCLQTSCSIHSSWSKCILFFQKTTQTLHMETLNGTISCEDMTAVIMRHCCTTVLHNIRTYTQLHVTQIHRLQVVASGVSRVRDDTLKNQGFSLTTPFNC